MKRFIAWFVLGLLSLTWAQLDPEAAPFLDYGRALQRAEKPGTLVVTLCITGYQNGNAQPELCTHSAIDYVKRRMAVRITAREEPRYNSNMVYQDGRIYMTDFGTDKLVMMPPEQAEPIAETLEKTFDTAMQNNFVPDQFDSTHYDGPVSYGKVIKGEQVSATVTLPFTDLKGSDPKPTTLRLVFNENKVLLGTLTPTDKGPLLSVINHPQTKVTPAQFFDTTSYRLEDKKPVLVSKSRVVQFQFDKPLDEKLFTVPQN